MSGRGDLGALRARLLFCSAKVPLMGARPCLLGAVEATSDDRGRGSTLGVVAFGFADELASNPTSAAWAIGPVVANRYITKKNVVLLRR